MNARRRRFGALSLGDSAAVSRSYGGAEIAAWRQLAWSDIDDPSLVPEPLIAGLFSYLLGERLPGHGTNYLKQTLEFAAHPRVDEMLTARVTVTRLRPEKALVNLQTVCSGEGGRPICRGEALVLFRH